MTSSDIILSLPKRFRPEKARDVKTNVHLDIEGEGGGKYTVTVDEGGCAVQLSLNGEPDCVVRASAETYAKVELGEINPQIALMTGKLRVSNISAMLAFMKLFRRYSEAEKDATKQPTAVQQPGRKPVSGPLQGIRILDLTRLLPGPMATMMMADLGAEVIKIEDKHSPDYVRSFPPYTGDGLSVPYLALNRSKRSMTLNLDEEEGKKLFLKLVSTADVVIEQYRPGVLDMMGIDYEAATKIKEDIIYVSITGYGQTGPYKDHAGHDLNYIGYSGILGLNGEKGGNPVMPGIQIADIAGGSYSAMNACMAAILWRNRSGQGQHVDVAMTDCIMPLMGLVLPQHYAGAKAERGDMYLSGGLANYNVYPCKDGRHIALGALEPKFWKGFCDLAGRPEWSDRIGSNNDETIDVLKQEVQALFLTKERDEWLVMAEGHDVCLSPVLEADELEDNPQLKAREMIIETGGIKSIGIPIKFGGSPGKIAWPAPVLGEDTESILKELNSEL